MSIAHVQSPAGGVENGAATSVNLAFGSNVTAASAICGGWRLAVNGRTVTLSDTRSNTYTSSAIVATDTADANSTSGSGFALNCAAGATTVTFAISGAASNLRFVISEFSGVATSGALDKTATAIGSNSPTATGSVTPDSDGELFYAVTHRSDSSTFTAGTDFTLNTTVPTTPLAQRLASERYIQPTAAAHTGSFTWVQGGASVTWGVTLMTLRATGGAALADPFINNRFLTLTGIGT